MASADGNTPQPTSAPSLCAKGCGFFGNANTGGMCSKCYKATVGLAPAPAPSRPSPATAPAPAAAPAPSGVHQGIPVASTPVPATPKTTETSGSSSSGATPAAASVAVPPKPETPTSASMTVRVESEEVDEEPPKKKQMNTNRCWTCNKKIGLLGFQCKCEYYFCAEHRYSDKHECAFDFKALGKQQLTKANPTIAPSKVASI